MSLDLAQYRQTLAGLARRGVYVGTSSWKYAGWQGEIYDRARYVARGRYSQTRFEASCLGEYAETYKTVCVDAAYYQFPEAGRLESMAAQTPADFLFAFKVTDAITVKTFPSLPRFGARAGLANPSYLDAGLFEEAFLGPCRAIQDRAGLLIFEFSQFHPRDYARGREFVEDLDRFLGALPAGWRYGVEIRNRAFLHPDYFAALARHGVAHVFNSWAGMPPVHEQLAMPGSQTAGFVGARFLLRPGRPYQEAVAKFSPYDQIREPYPEARQAGAAIVRQAIQANPQAGPRAFVYVNNRLEGSAPRTIAAMLEQASREGG